ncbi:MAG TPA: phage tail protein [Acidimicrobiales bacterium]|nr:phage tail protein [Acidimicrobiales bacterium]
MADPLTDPALSVYFEVSLDTAALGQWSTCSGLGLEIEHDPKATGSVSTFMHHFTGRIKYTNLTLSRPVCPDTSKVMTWLSTFSSMPVPGTASVAALDTEGNPIMTWELYGVVPVKWTGPSFDSSNLQIATETLELAYTGFL